MKEFLDKDNFKYGDGYSLFDTTSEIGYEVNRSPYYKRQKMILYCQGRVSNCKDLWSELSRVDKNYQRQVLSRVTLPAKLVCLDYFPDYGSGEMAIVNGFCLIHWTAVTGNASVLKRLLEFDEDTGTRYLKVDLKGMSSNWSSDWEFSDWKSTWSQYSHPWITTLRLAVIMGHVQVLNLLLEGSEQQWIQALKKDNSCNTCLFPFDSPIHLAASYVNSSVVKDVFNCFGKLIRLSQPEMESHWMVVTRNSLGETALHRAAALNNGQAILAILSQLSHRRDVDCLDNKKRTPLWHAAATGSYDALIHLLGQGADPNTRDDDHITVLQAACHSSGSEAVVKVLLSWVRTIMPIPLLSLHPRSRVLHA